MKLTSTSLNFINSSPPKSLNHLGRCVPYSSLLAAGFSKIFAPPSTSIIPAVEAQSLKHMMRNGGATFASMQVALVSNEMQLSTSLSNFAFDACSCNAGWFPSRIFRRTATFITTVVLFDL
jgi:hypothetical protein